jgi:hypothetical protein
MLKNSTKEEEKLDNSNKGHLRLLKYLESEWPTMIREDCIWNEYQCYSEDLISMTDQGILIEVPNMSDNKSLTHYKLGIRGFEYLHLRRMNGFLKKVGIATIIATIIATTSLLISISLIIIK